MKNSAESENLLQAMLEYRTYHSGVEVMNYAAALESEIKHKGITLDTHEAMAIEDWIPFLEKALLMSTP